MSVDRALLEGHLAIADWHIARGMEHIAQQKEVIAKLKAEGLDIGFATDLLRIFEQSGVLHTEHRERLFKALAEVRPVADSQKT